MIARPELGVILEPLEKRFKKLTKEQAEIYHERLKHFAREALEAAVVQLVDDAKTFPSPGEIRKMAIEKANELRRSGKVKDRERWCVHCHRGYVFYARPDRHNSQVYVAPCGHCHSGEYGPVPYMVQAGDSIYDASEVIRKGGLVTYRAAPALQQLYSEAEPVYSDAWLKSYYEGPTTGATTEMAGKIADTVNGARRI
jgi:hypothetical protein